MQRLASPLQRLIELPPAERRIGPFVLVRQLGHGGFAPVWLAREVYGDAELRTAAVKLFALDGSPSARARVIAEARALCRVEHPNVVRFYALPIDEERGIMGLAMEHVDGTSLHARLAVHGRLSAAETVDVGAAIAAALAALHRVNLLHRDVKPANVVEAGGAYKLIDFGIASADEIGDRSPRPGGSSARELGDLPLSAVGARASALEETARFELPCGTVGYIDPAILAAGAPATTASDLYALGATLFECLTGRVPAALPGSGLRGEVLDGRASAPKTRALAPATPAVLAGLVDALLAPSPRDRPASADDVARALDRLRGRRPRSSGRVAALVAGSAVLAVVGGGIAYRRALGAQAEVAPPAIASAAPVPSERRPVPAPVPAPPKRKPRPAAKPEPRILERAEAGSIPVLSFAVAEGRLPWGAWLPAFSVRREPGDEGLPWLDAAERCRERGLALCTEAQWIRACDTDPRLGAIASWTASAVGSSGFTARGGASCDDREVAAGSSASPSRAGVCCSRAVAIQSSDGDASFLAATQRRLLAFEAANREGGAALGALFADSLHFYGAASMTRKQALARVDAAIARAPDVWVSLDTCEVSADGPAGTWTADCRKVARQDGKVAYVLTRLVWSRDEGRIVSLDDLKIMRAFAAP